MSLWLQNIKVHSDRVKTWWQEQLRGERQRETERDRERERQRERDRERQTETDRERAETERETDRDRQTETETERGRETWNEWYHPFESLKPTPSDTSPPSTSPSPPNPSQTVPSTGTQVSKHKSVWIILIETTIMLINLEIMYLKKNVCVV